METPLHPIQVVASRTGLSPHVIRVWEKRYGAVKPARTDSNRRLYTDADVERFKLLKALTEAGQSIGYIASHSDERLRALLNEGRGEGALTIDNHPGGEKLDTMLERALGTIQSYDAPGLEVLLRRAELQLGGQGVLRHVIGPLVQAIGERWRTGNLTAAHEHFATATLRVFLSSQTRQYASSDVAPKIVVVTPLGQLHELGALLVAASAANLGWRVIYLGASLPAAEIAGAAIQHKARAVALSIVYPADDSNLGTELRRLRTLLPDAALIAGGRVAGAYGETLTAEKYIVPSDLAAFGDVLDALRTKPGGALA